MNGVISKWQIVIRSLSVIFIAIILHTPITNYRLPITKAQALPEIMLTWKADNYVPPDYPGKVLPIGDTRIDVSMEVIDGGRFADVSQLEIRWLINGNTQRTGRGLKSVSFNANGLKVNQVVDVTVANYRGVNIEDRLIIPLATPEVAVAGGPTVFQALPYFFNIARPSDAKYTWTANGFSVSGAGANPNIIDLDLENVPIGAPVNLVVLVQNPLKILEIASRSIQFIKL